MKLQRKSKDANHDCVLHYCIIFVRMGLLHMRLNPISSTHNVIHFPVVIILCLRYFALLVILTSGVEHSQMQEQVAFTCEILMGTST